MLIIFLNKHNLIHKKKVFYLFWINILNCVCSIVVNSFKYCKGLHKLSYSRISSIKSVFIDFTQTYAISYFVYAYLKLVSIFVNVKGVSFVLYHLSYL